VEVDPCLLNLSLAAAQRRAQDRVPSSNMLATCDSGIVDDKLLKDEDPHSVNLNRLHADACKYYKCWVKLYFLVTLC